MSGIAERILKEIGDPDLLRKLSELSPSDFNSMLLELYRTRAERITANDLMKSVQTNRYSLPSALNPAEYYKLQAELLSEAEKQGLEGVLLSPAALLGSCSVFGCVNQKNVLSAGKGTEMLSDPTNMLAIIISDRIKKGMIDNSVPVHYCSAVRVTRGQAFVGPRSFPHFGIFCIVSSGKDTGSYACERELLVKQLAYYKKLFLKKYSARMSAVLSKRGGYTDNDGFYMRMSELVKTELPDVPLSFDEEHADNAYYKGINYQIYIHMGDEKILMGDGGFVDWTQKLTGSKKERCLISGIGTDRMLMI